MKGDNHQLAVTVAKDEVTGEVKPLFSFPIQICAATESKEPRFDIAAPSGAPRTQQYVDSATGKVVEDADCLRGVRTGDSFKAISPEDIEQIAKATKIDTMVALGTMPLAKVPFDRATGTYFVQSPVKGGSAKAYRLVFEALRAVVNGKGKVLSEAQALVTKRTARSRQKLCVIYPSDEFGCLMMVELRFKAQLRKPDDEVLAPQQAQVDAQQIVMARKVIAGLGDGIAALDAEKDDVLALREDLIEQALAGQALTMPTPIAATKQTDDLEALLEASLAAL